MQNRADTQNQQKKNLPLVIYIWRVNIQHSLGVRAHWPLVEKRIFITRKCSIWLYFIHLLSRTWNIVPFVLYLIYFSCFMFIYFCMYIILYARTVNTLYIAIMKSCVYRVYKYKINIKMVYKQQNKNPFKISCINCI